MNIIIWVDHYTDGPVGVAYGPEANREVLQRKAKAQAYKHRCARLLAGELASPSDYTMGETRDDEGKTGRGKYTVLP